MGWHSTITAKESEARAALERFIREAPIEKLESMLSEMLYDHGYNARVVSDAHAAAEDGASDAKGDDSVNLPQWMDVVSDGWLDGMVDLALEKAAR